MPRGPSDTAAPTLLQRVLSNQRFEFHNSNNEVLNYFPLLSIVPVLENKKLTCLNGFVCFSRLEKGAGDQRELMRCGYVDKKSAAG